MVKVHVSFQMSPLKRDLCSFEEKPEVWAGFRFEFQWRFRVSSFWDRVVYVTRTLGLGIRRVWHASLISMCLIHMCGIDMSHVSKCTWSRTLGVFVLYDRLQCAISWYIRVWWITWPRTLGVFVLYGRLECVISWLVCHTYEWVMSRSTIDRKARIDKANLGFEDTSLGVLYGELQCIMCGFIWHTHERVMSRSVTHRKPVLTFLLSRQCTPRILRRRFI